MEPSKVRIEDRNVDKALKHVYENALNSPVILKESPTKDSLKANTAGYYDGKLYIRFANGKMYEFPGTEVT